MSNPLTTGWDGGRFRFTLTLENPTAAPEDAAKVSEKLLPFIAENKIPSHAAAAIHTAVEELLTNLGKFGRLGLESSSAQMPLKAEGLVEMKEESVELCLRDNGAAFDPTRQSPPVFTDDPELLIPGGLGLYMLRSMFTSFSYHCVDGKNISVWTITTTPEVPN